MQIQQFLNASKPVKILVYIWLASRCEDPRVSPISKRKDGDRSLLRKERI